MINQMVQTILQIHDYCVSYAKERGKGWVRARLALWIIANGYIPSSEAGCGTTFYTNNQPPFRPGDKSRGIDVYVCMRPPDDGTKQICTYIPLTAHMHVDY